MNIKTTNMMSFITFHYHQITEKRRGSVPTTCSTHLLYVLYSNQQILDSSPRVLERLNVLGCTPSQRLRRTVKDLSVINNNLSALRKTTVWQLAISTAKYNSCRFNLLHTKSKLVVARYCSGVGAAVISSHLHTHFNNYKWTTISTNIHIPA